ncbi:ArsR family transcriptional regulator [Amycolatopsis acidiphila]|uniref:ArsR family transcriptional regulator n=1 Tax=Amycolatopsis acidiphila TaxID=715473 RepID=A0A557ZZU2_9PSEU|nr:ArsR family transcriptional regulator [Amycolatopsis acidiphila]TVT17533.1 ArsR family transcriptional regulator [Amycolatopsis acidiphila]UIJ57667.1 ArsR family transcriptional regulator [Amycolatopsis acidiphila]GHG95468.1 ArsR family transcriptional regulator [Amycolatopsis acidiphila]
MVPTDAPPLIVRLLADPLRWRLARKLAASDLRVRELVTAVGQPQNLVSYHLGQLRSAGLVTARRSSFDGRDSYYHLDLARCAKAWADAGAALHPGLRPGFGSPVGAQERRSGRSAPAARSRVLFLCTGNSGRSPLAEALLRYRVGNRVEVASAGSHPKPLHANAVRAAAEYGITLEHQPTHLDSVRRRRFDLVVSLCDRVREVCPAFPGRPVMIHWSIPDPAREPGTDGDTYPAFRRTAAELDSRIHFLPTTLTDDVEESRT